MKKNDLIIEKHYRVAEVAELLSMSAGTIRRKIANGRIKAIKNDGRNGTYLIPETELRKYLKTLDV